MKLYNLFFIADIIVMKTAVLIIAVSIFILMPIIFGVKLYFDSDNKKLNFGVYFFDYFRLIKGQITFTKKRIILNIRNKRISYPYKKFLDNRKKLDVFSNFEITSISSLMEIGSANNKITPLIIAGAYCSLGSAILSFIKNRNPLMRAYNGVYIHEDKQYIKYNFSINVMFNILFLIIAVIKKITEKIINGKRNKQNRQSNC